jgi:hypothetical protein
MYNKCDKCQRQLEFHEQRKLVLNSYNKVSTNCMPCYKQFSEIQSIKL